MSIINGLASYEIFKSSLTVVILAMLLMCASYFVYSSYDKNYVTTKCNITTNNNQTQTLTYSVNDKNYTQTIPFVVNKNNNKTPSFSNGICTVYYAEKNPNDYSVNYNPLYITGGISSLLCILLIGSIAWVFFLNSNRDIAGVMGGLNVTKNMIGSFK